MSNTQKKTGKFIGEGRTVSCPRCHVSLYEHCQTVSGRKLNRAHAERVAEAERVRLKWMSESVSPGGTRLMETYDEPEFDPPKITCCESAKATGGAYHSPDCIIPYSDALSEYVADLDDLDERRRRLGNAR